MRTAASNAGRCARKRNAIEKRPKPPIHTQITWKVSGELRGSYLEKRISAANEDTAITDAYALGFTRIDKCVRVIERH